jgi:hypothetical protein
MIKANMDIREYMADHGVTQKMVAKAMSVSQYTISAKLSKELSQKDKEEWLNIIDSISSDNREAIVEEATEEVIEEATEEAKDEDLETEESDVEEAEEEVSADVTCGPKFQIGDRVRIPSKALRIGIVSDIWHSLAQNKLMYAVDTEGGTRRLYAEEQLEPAPIPIEYSWEAHIDGNVAVFTMNAKQGEKEWVYARGHAHIIHDGEVGMAQAVSYAARRMFESLDSNQENKIYLKEGK